ncbi:hypothetical protein KIN20_008927 [Parelaphostrongylus tenuis]|uniref:Uncharacterized protein n=1 Tax=Parelaphostrongylus tenuis TaxID=148309 RepID=A0AAD5MAE3_PARTN|nr:hypothetical protein KIN20_008927 [Parelaphostrongylus tenuis]
MGVTDFSEVFRPSPSSIYSITDVVYFVMASGTYMTYPQIRFVLLKNKCDSDECRFFDRIHAHCTVRGLTEPYHLEHGRENRNRETLRSAVVAN